MNRIAFLFPGQGSQYIGMGQELVNNFTEAEKIINSANDILDIDLKTLLFYGPENVLNNTQNTQPAIFTVSYIIYQILKKKNIIPEMLAGHSLGEYSALAAANVFSFEDGLELVKQRGVIMNQAIPDSQGAMAAIIGLDADKVLLICQKVEGICEVANYNSPGQLVISGEKKAILEAGQLAEEYGAKKVVQLDVSGPFHSSLMKVTEEKFTNVINKVELGSPKYPIVANVSANFVDDPVKIKESLIRQLSASVRWVDSINLMISSGINTFIEVGPGRVLKGLMRQIDRSVNAYNVEDIKSLDRLLSKL